MSGFASTLHPALVTAAADRGEARRFVFVALRRGSARARLLGSSSLAAPGIAPDRGRG